MPPELIFLLVSAAVAVLLGAGAVLATVRGQRRAAAAENELRLPEPAPQPDKYDPGSEDIERRSASGYATAVRVLWWVSIAGVLIGVGLSNTYDSTQAGIYAVGAVAVVAAVLLHDLLPVRFRSRPVVALEVLLAIGLITALAALTDYGNSPFLFGYDLVAVAVALALNGPMAMVVAMVATLAFLGVLLIDPALSSYGPPAFLRFGLQIGSIWLLAYVAGVFASGERRMRASVLQMSRTDTLTGLYNRSQLFPTLEEEVQRTRRSARGFCLLMIDLDGLKGVNDTYGHHRGDEVLRELGNVFRHSIRLVDTAYRYAGDEFLVLLPETDFAGAFVVAEKIRLGAEEIGLAAGGGEMLTSVSIGLVSCPEDGNSAEELMIAADRAMYQAKSLGKNQVSGNPRPRRLAYTPDHGPDTPVARQPSPALVADELTAPPPAERAVFSVEPELLPQAPIPMGPIVEEPVPAPQPGVAVAAASAAAASAAAASAAADAPEEDEADPSEVRRQIAAARRNMDPDHQIRRAMDAFLSPTRPNDPPN